MISLPVLFWVFIGFFTIIGTIRGWAKELMVTFSGIVAIFIIRVLLPLMKIKTEGNSHFWASMIVFGMIIFFGYQTPNFRRLSESGRFLRVTLKDTIFGAMIGFVNGYLVIGSIWYYMAAAGYPISSITAPAAGSSIAESAAKILQAAPPSLLQGNLIYFAIGISFVIVLVIFI